MNFNVGDVLQARYDLFYVFASYLVSVLGSFAALYHAQHMFRRDGTIKWSIAIGAAVALGGIGIWTMHFIGMMGYRLPLRVVYDGGLTVLSLVAAIVIAGIALILAGGRGKFSKVGWLAGSLLAGAGVCVMHYMGMYAMSLRADMTLDLATVAVSVVIAMTAAAAALWLAFHVVRNTHRIAAALVMGVAVCAMHYTGMASAQFVCIASKQPPAWAIGGDNLPILVFAVAGMVLVVLSWNVLGLVGNTGAARAAAGTRSAPGAARKVAAKG
jgi:NO-binding membrane sensor protein with MHYT domain